MTLRARKRLFFISLTFGVLFLFFIFFEIYILVQAIKLKNANPILVDDEIKTKALTVFYQEKKYNPNLVELDSNQYVLANKNLNLKAKSYILVDVLTGSILLEKNADMIIPPASLTKLVAIDTALNDTKNKFKDLEKLIIPPKQAWAEFLPEKSSAMGLGENQRLSLNELLLGMSVCSGNDAALALAIYTSGSVSKFAKLMNANVKNLGLKNTSFVESSGLSDDNQTTAREFAKFCINYIRKRPENLKKFHGVKEIAYPKAHNLIKKPNPLNKDEKKKFISMKKKATNTLLNKISGCDGLKTGFIYKSGFNIAITAKRKGSRFLAVILGGEGDSFFEGKLIREKNSKKLMEYAFDNFVTIDISAHQKLLKKIVLLDSNLDISNAAFIPIIAKSDLSSRYITVNKKYEGIEQRIVQPKTLHAPIKAGQEIGYIEYIAKYKSEDGAKLHKDVLKRLSLIAPIDVELGSSWSQFISNSLLANAILN